MNNNNNQKNPRINQITQRNSSTQLEDSPQKSPLQQKSHSADSLDLNSSPIGKKIDSELLDSSYEDDKFQKINNIQKQNKKSQQFKALFCKSLAISKKQYGTNFCQMATPLISLIFIQLITYLLKDQVNFNFELKVPQLLNVPNIQAIYPFFKNTTCHEWYYFDFSQNATLETKNFIGYNDGKGKSFGMLDNIDQFYCPSPTYENSPENIPYFQKPIQNQSINQNLLTTLKHLNKQPLHLGKQDDITDLYQLPDGALEIDIANKHKLKYKLQVNDVKLPNLHRNNGVTKYIYEKDESEVPFMQVETGQIKIADMVHRSFIKEVNDKVFILSGTSVMQISGQEERMLQKLISVSGATIFPLSLSLLFPVFIYSLVHEKDERILQMMIMNGMKLKFYWLVFYLYSFIISFITLGSFYLFGYYVIQLQIFVETSQKLFIIALLGWAHAQVCISQFFSVFINKSSTATLLGYLISIMTALLSISLNLIVFPYPLKLPYKVIMYPPAAFSRILYYIGTECTDKSGCIQDYDNMPEEINDCLISLYINSTIFFILGIYIYEIIPKEYGIRQHPLFFLQKLPIFCQTQKQQIVKFQYKEENKEEGQLFLNIQKRNSFDDEDNPQSLENQNLQFGIQNNQFQQDQDCQKENQKVNQIQDYSKYALVIKNLTKIYPKVQGQLLPHTAVDKLNLQINKGEIFGLLGPNGAGKTSLISILTGIYEQTKGDAWVGGYNIAKDVENIHQIMGVCPQFDLQWPDLTVQEHLEFYCRLKGISSNQETHYVKKAMKEVKLEKFAHRISKSLSGGMRRRLSVAISLVGDPQIIFLDEPSTGLDPDNRRQMWEILSKCRNKRAMFLTTHSMQEADVLCNRIGIIVKGVMRCIGSQQKLKSKYGQGFQLQINCFKEKYFLKIVDKNINVFTFMQKQYQLTCKFIQDTVPSSMLIQQFNGNFIFQIPNKEGEDFQISNLVKQLEKNKQKYHIQDWGISQSSLEDVFMQIVEQSY